MTLRPSLAEVWAAFESVYGVRLPRKLTGWTAAFQLVALNVFDIVLPGERITFHKRSPLG